MWFGIRPFGSNRRAGDRGGARGGQSDLSEDLGDHGRMFDGSNDRTAAADARKRGVVA